MLIRQAVVPNVMLWPGMAVMVPSQQQSASTSTSGAVRDFLIVCGNARLRGDPEERDTASP
jgi:hypothetical protein